MAEFPVVDGRGGRGAFGRVRTTERFRRGPLRPGVEVAHDRGPVVLRDERNERLGKLALVGDVDPVGDVLLEDLGGDLGVQLVVDVLAAGLVLDERERVRQLADVVVIRRHAGKERIRADRFRRPLGEVADHQRMVIGAGRLDEQPSHERLRRVRQLEQLENRQDPEEVAEDRKAADGRDGRAGRRRKRGTDELEEPTEIMGTEQGERRYDQDVGDGDREPGLDEDLEPIAAANGEDPGEPAEQDVRGQLQRVAVEGTGDHRQDDHDRRGDARIEEDRQQHSGHRRRHDERQARPAGRCLQHERDTDDDQADQQHRVVAVPQVPSEPPQPRQQQPDDHDGEEQPAA